MPGVNSKHTTPRASLGSNQQKSSQRSPRSSRGKTNLSALQNGALSGGVPNIAMEAQAVEAILAGRRRTAGDCGGSSWGMWAAIVAMEVVFFLWIQWAMDIYRIYRAANP